MVKFGITGLLQQLLALKWTEPGFVEVLGHYLEALGLFLKYSPNAVGSVISKLFELLTSLPLAVKVVFSSEYIILLWILKNLLLSNFEYIKCLLDRILQQAKLGMQDCKFAPHLSVLQKLLIKAFYLT